MNLVAFTGRLGRDPRMQYAPSGTAVANFRFAVGLAKEKTLWFDVTVWGNQAENVNKYLHKGSFVAVWGSLDVDEWEGDDGVRRSSQVIKANYVKFLDPKEGGSSSGNESSYVKPLPDGGTDADVDSLGEEGFGSFGDDDFPL